MVYEIYNWGWWCMGDIHISDMEKEYKSRRGHE